MGLTGGIRGQWLPPFIYRRSCQKTDGVVSQRRILSTYWSIHIPISP